MTENKLNEYWLLDMLAQQELLVRVHLLEVSDRGWDVDLWLATAVTDIESDDYQVVYSKARYTSTHDVPDPQLELNIAGYKLDNFEARCRWAIDATEELQRPIWDLRKTVAAVESTGREGMPLHKEMLSHLSILLGMLIATPQPPNEQEAGCLAMMRHRLTPFLDWSALINVLIQRLKQ